MAAKAKKTAPGAKPPTKSELYTSIAEETGLSRKQVGSVFDAFAEELKKNLGGRGSGKFVVPGLMKVKVIKKPATKARKGINPFTKEETIFKAKPARKVVKIQPMKALKSMV
ncbi:DNA-binding protein [Aggregicoccus sp. 17bor-14]|uniref:HU family DNA-binding protein n=1 Tax=Myxococcaceae TaxID=31 RepID=UPI00129CBBAF|nr:MULTISPECIES: HU family DNA-binding protein [Myxococcaceae]MBF5043810.1 HU family DNA-binding protein [Simulacricoccus sp. 17bor-14]MRI89563.1 DNA-binding protein [Aggregicoccus sp. 17bor-14]